MQLGNTWAAEKMETKRDQSKPLNIVMVLWRGGDSCRNAGAANQGATSQPRPIGGWDEGCDSCLPTRPWSHSAAQAAELLSIIALTVAFWLDAHGLEVVASLLASQPALQNGRTALYESRNWTVER